MVLQGWGVVSVSFEALSVLPKGTILRYMRYRGGYLIVHPEGASLAPFRARVPRAHHDSEALRDAARMQR